nr:acyltransferase family protein [Sphingomonas abaci]
MSVWRALLMLAGIALHATMGREDYPPFAAINIASGAFRMGTFFIISGLLTGFALIRQPAAGAWLRRRVVRLVLPLMVGLGLVFPAVAVVSGTRAGAWWTRNPHHLWFLGALILYTMIGHVLWRSALAARLLGRIERAAARSDGLQARMVLVAGLLSFLLITLTLPVRIAAPPAWQPLARPLPLIAGYAPMFLLGLAMARMPVLRHALTRRSRLPVAVLLAAATIALASHQRLWPAMPAARLNWWGDLIDLACAAWCPPAAAALVLRSALAIRRVPPLLVRLSDASFTMYLLHYPVILAVKTVANPWHLGPWTDFDLALIVGGGLSYLVHRLGVERSATLAWLLNGRPLRSRAAATPMFAPKPV